MHYLSSKLIDFDFKNVVVCKKDSEFPTKNLFPDRCLFLNDNSELYSYQVLKLVKESEVIITFGCPLLKNKLLKLAPNRIFNLHTGILPKYRGVDSHIWACYNKDFKNLGYTIHMVDEGIDTGTIVCKKRIRKTSLKYHDFYCVDIKNLLEIIALESLPDLVFICELSGMIESSYGLSSKSNIFTRIKNKIIKPQSKLYQHKDLTLEVLRQADRNLKNYLKTT